MDITFNSGEKIPELEQGFYIVRLSNRTIVLLTKTEIIEEKLSNLKYMNENGEFKILYDIEKGALEELTIEKAF